MKYCKIRFTNVPPKQQTDSTEYTTGIVLTQDQFQNRTITEHANMYPYSESMKLVYRQQTDYFDTWDEAFNANWS